MDKLDLNKAYHQLATEACKVQRRLDLIAQHREFMNKLWKNNWNESKSDNYCCQDCEGQEAEYGKSTEH